MVRSKLSYLQSRSAKQEVLCPLGGINQWCNTAVNGGKRVSAAAFLCIAVVIFTPSVEKLSDFNLTSDFHNFFFAFISHNTEILITHSVRKLLIQRQITHTPSFKVFLMMLPQKVLRSLGSSRISSVFILKWRLLRIFLRERM